MTLSATVTWTCLKTGCWHCPFSKPGRVGISALSTTDWNWSGRAGRPDVRISGTIEAFLLISNHLEDPDTLFFSNVN